MNIFWMNSGTLFLPQNIKTKKFLELTKYCYLQLHLNDQILIEFTKAQNQYNINQSKRNLSLVPQNILQPEELSAKEIMSPLTKKWFPIHSEEVRIYSLFRSIAGIWQSIFWRAKNNNGIWEIGWDSTTQSSHQFKVLKGGEIFDVYSYLRLCFDNYQVVSIDIFSGNQKIIPWINFVPKSVAKKCKL